METIHFEAQQVTKEMQGIEISGFAVWSVHREGDGPFKYYKYVGTDSDKANANIKLVAEASVRHVIANSSINEVMTNRSLIRNQIKKGIMEACSGWGVWCETVEIKTVNICSRQLFEDLQVQFRECQHLAAEKRRLETRQQISEEKLDTDLKIAEKKSKTDAQKILFESQTRLQSQADEAKIYEKQAELRVKKIDRDKKISRMELEAEHESAKQIADQKQLIEKQQNEHTLELLRSRMEVEGAMSEVNLQKYAIDSTKEIFQKLPLRNVELTNFINPNDNVGLGALLPGLQQLQAISTGGALKKA